MLQLNDQLALTQPDEKYVTTRTLIIAKAILRKARALLEGCYRPHKSISARFRYRKRTFEKQHLHLEK